MHMSMHCTILFQFLFQFCLFQSCFSSVSVLFSLVSVLFQSCSALFQPCFSPVSDLFNPVLQSCFSPVPVLFQPYFLLKFTNLESGSPRAPLGKLIMTSRGAIISARPSLLDVFRSSTIKIFFCKRKKKMLCLMSVHSDTRTFPSPPMTGG